jgi:hypothetical protein
MFDTSFLRNDVREPQRVAQASRGTGCYGSLGYARGQLREYGSHATAKFVRFVQRVQALGVELIHGLRALMERKTCKLRMRR